MEMISDNVVWIALCASVIFLCLKELVSGSISNSAKSGWKKGYDLSEEERAKVDAAAVKFANNVFDIIDKFRR